MFATRKVSLPPLASSVITELLEDSALRQENVAARSELRDIARERDPEIFRESLFVFGQRQEEAGNEALALRVYRALVGLPTGGQAAADPGAAEVARRASNRLMVLSGRGTSFGDQVEGFFRRFGEQAPTAALTLVPGWLAFKTVRLAAWNGLLSRMAGNALLRRVGAPILASLAGIGAEVPVMTATQHALGHGVGSWKSDLAANYRLMLGMRGVGGVAALFSRLPGMPRVLQQLLPQAGTLGGIYLTQGPDLSWSQALLTLADFHINGVLAGRFLGTFFAARERALEQAARRSPNISESWKKPEGRELLFAGVAKEAPTRAWMEPGSSPKNKLGWGLSLNQRLDDPPPSGTAAPLGKPSEAGAESKLDPVVNRNRWYGFYDPSQPPPVVSAADLARWSELLRQPLSSRRQAEEFIAVTARMLPTFRLALGERPPSVRFWEDNFPSYVPSSPQAGSLFCLPRDQAVGSYLHNFFMMMAGVLPPPPGVQLPPKAPSGTEREIREAFMRVYRHGLALGKSFVFQIAHELGVLGLTISPSGEQLSLAASDLARFQIFRDQGLPGLAEAYLRFDEPYLRVLSESVMEERVREASARPNAGAPVPWAPPEMGEKPPLPRTQLDEDVDARLPFHQGLYRRASISTRLSELERVRIHQALESRILEEQDLLEVQHLIEKLAPELSREILTPWKEQQVEVLILRENPDVLERPVVLEGDLETLIGMDSELGPKNAELPKLVVSRGLKIKDALERFVLSLGQLAAPPEVHPPMQIPRMSDRRREVQSLAVALESRYTRHEAWGHSALFELYHEAEQVGVRLEKFEDYDSMGEILRDGGFDVLCERWAGSFLNFQELVERRTEFLQLAQEMLGGRSDDFS